jgi:hypothetical protein
LFFVFELGFDERSGDPPFIDAKPYREVAIEKKVALVDFEIEGSFDHAPTARFHGFVGDVEGRK